MDASPIERPLERPAWLSRKTFLAGALIALVIGPQAARAQDLCPQFVGQTIYPLSFSVAVAPFRKLSAKSEFESTQEYEARVAKTLGAAATNPLIIAKPLQKRYYLEYDADSQKLRISAWAFGHHLNAWAIFLGSPHWNKLSPDVSANFDVVISDPDVLIGSYAATNAFGVGAKIRRYRRTTSAIFDHAGDGGRADLFPSSTEETGFVVGELAMSPAQAITLKSAISLAFVVVPKAPYWFAGSRIVTLPTLDNPKRIDEDFSVLIADIQCGLVLDGTHKVLAAYTTR